MWSEPGSAPTHCTVSLNITGELLCFGAALGNVQGYTWLCTQKLYGMPRIEYAFAACKANALSAVLFLSLLSNFILIRVGVCWATPGSTPCRLRGPYEMPGMEPGSDGLQDICCAITPALLGSF